MEKVAVLLMHVTACSTTHKTYPIISAALCAIFAKATCVNI